MMHIITGLFFIALGIWGVFDEWYYVVDFVKGGSPVVLISVGAIAMLAGLAKPGTEPLEATIPDASGLAPDDGEED